MFGIPSLVAAAAGLLAASGPIVLVDTTTLSTYGRLLGTYVTPAGVCYDAWRAAPKDVSSLSRVVRELSAQDPRSLSPADRKALYINLYNAKVLEIVVTRAPKTSIRELDAGSTGLEVFRKPVLEVSGKSISLEDLDRRLREDAKDPRVLLALSRAARSGPPISPEPYDGKKIEAQLDRCARVFLSAPGELTVATAAFPSGAAGARVVCSKIFDWYGDDFDVVGGVAVFLQKYAPAAVSKSIASAGERIQINFREYDWSLNRASACTAP